MSSSRRSFLALLPGAVAAALTLDPEKLLWTPGKKLISIPKPPTPFLLCPEGILAVKMRILMDAYIEPAFRAVEAEWRLDEAAFARSWPATSSRISGIRLGRSIQS